LWVRFLIGAVQELTYEIPIKKWNFEIKISFYPRTHCLTHLFHSRLLSLSRYSPFLLYYSIFPLKHPINILFIFLAILFISVFIYQPFCRIIYPFGALFSLTAIKSLFKVKLSNEFTECKKCEAAWLTCEAGWKVDREERCLCGRCSEVELEKNRFPTARSNRNKDINIQFLTFFVKS